MQQANERLMNAVMATFGKFDVGRTGARPTGQRTGGNPNFSNSRVIHERHHVR